MLGATLAPAASAATTAKAKIIKRYVTKAGGHKVTVTIFTRAGKKYRAREWYTGTGSKRVKHRYVYLMKGKAKAIPSVTSNAAVQKSCTVAQQGAMQNAYETFYKHLQAAHLSTSPVDQVKAILSDPDAYVKLHTALVQNMIDPAVADGADLPEAVMELIDIFMKHVGAAHLAVSPVDQVVAITTDPDGYVKLHTALVSNMLAPLLAWADKFSEGTASVCSDTTAAAPTGTTTPAAVVPISIKGSAFPATTSVAVGSKVTWTNDDDVPHTVTSMHGGPLASGNLTKGQSYSYTFTTAGTYMYVCDVHPDMMGEIDVK